MAELRDQLQQTLGDSYQLERLGENDEAITRLEELLRVPSANSRKLLRLHPEFAELRKDPRFQKLIQG